eukprot:TRINITY_DN16958_c0_g1_i1.p1 TRINITY_DN16958_c0_g1~~TRINITY_DN16958_c0_g1_i1.p1  ORF type:complete len:130 (+),score=25.06 TRINITY_DN16958_c0_g1_i1:71-460(+)
MCIRDRYNSESKSNASVLDSCRAATERVPVNFGCRETSEQVHSFSVEKLGSVYSSTDSLKKEIGLCERVLSPSKEIAEPTILIQEESSAKPKRRIENDEDVLKIEQLELNIGIDTVSYTHLTLPTICSV